MFMCICSMNVYFNLTLELKYFILLSVYIAFLKIYFKEK